ncbi:MAG: hypothetical protein IH987_11560, partial [Planctomycetes bacterium]|nr:hypothetical protein [Planctomycetota bacterium]
MLDVEQRSVPSEAGAPLWQKVRAELGDYFRKNIRRDVPILTFHRIRRRDGIKVETLTRILDFVASEYRVFTLGELAVTLDRKTRLPRNGIVLTFDDGTKDQFELAGPELNKRGLRATFALVGCTLLERTVPPLFAYFHMLETTQMRSVRFGFKALLAKRTWSLDEAGRRELTNMRSPIVRAIQESRHCVGAEIVATFGAAVGAASVAIGLSLAIVALAGKLPYFREMTDGEFMPIALSPMPFLVAVGAGLLCLSILVIPGALSARAGLLLQ